ncbi:MAG: ATP-binding protein, partial [Ignavibacteria bacterium]|nr:ATP-binding protein [Ignavibacteria bacterium]
SNINQAIVRILDKEILFHEVTNIAVKDGKFIMAWVGLFNENCTNIIQQSFNGDEACSLSLQELLLRKDNSGTCRIIMEKENVICNDISKECPEISFHEGIIKSKCRSFVFLPLIVNKDKIGVIALYSDTLHFFDEKEMKLLSELALDVSFAIEFIEHEEDRKLAVEELNKLNEELEYRIKERTRLLEISNHELESFAYSVSHDLRAPLRAINGFSKFLEEDYASILDDEGKRHLKVIRDNSQKMDQLITDLLSLSKVARVNLNKASIDITSLVKNIYDELIPEKLKNVFTFKVGKLADCYGDPTMIKQLWVNLISNAIKYTKPRDKKEIEIGGEIVDDDIVYYIRDSGVGFDPTYKHKLFGIFQRLHGEEEFEGTGVGLAIVKRIAERHFGKVWADAELNVGATFFFSIPNKER